MFKIFNGAEEWGVCLAGSGILTIFVLVMDESFQLMAAPLQGFTEAEWRVAHNRIAGGATMYFSPFIRVEKGVVRARDLRDVLPERNEGVTVVPQAICRDVAEFSLIADEISGLGYDCLDLNLGCPFKPQVKHGRGAGLLANKAELERVAEEMSRRGDVQFSVKMRLGVNGCDEWRDAVGVINDMPLRFVTVHPRCAVQQYAGELDMAEFEALVGALKHPVVFNGEVREPSDIERIRESYPQLLGVMVGRGLLARPSLFSEWRCGEVMDSVERRRGVVMAIHDEVLGAFEARLCGDSQLLMKMRPFWEYAGADFERKVVKHILKAGSLSSYRRAVDEAMR